MSDKLYYYKNKKFIKEINVNATEIYNYTENTIIINNKGSISLYDIDNDKILHEYFNEELKNCNKIIKDE